MRSRIVAFAVAITLLPAAVFAAGASEKSDVTAVVQRFTDSLNKGDVKAALATCAAQSTIIDEFPPYHWQGNACTDWVNDFQAFNKQAGITEPIAKIGKPRHVDITADRAYVVVPASYTYKEHGKRKTESGSTMTAALQKGADGWRISGWAWSKH
jgi:ketosteroid isomerase-like protein